jgi:hypothetical protein
MKPHTMNRANDSHSQILFLGHFCSWVFFSLESCNRSPVTTSDPGNSVIPLEYQAVPASGVVQLYHYNPGNNPVTLPRGQTRVTNKLAVLMRTEIIVLRAGTNTAIATNQIVIIKDLNFDLNLIAYSVLSMMKQRQDPTCLLLCLGCCADIYANISHQKRPSASVNETSNPNHTRNHLELVLIFILKLIMPTRSSQSQSQRAHTYSIYVLHIWYIESSL